MYWGYPGIRSPLLTVRFHRIFSFWFSYFFVISETFTSYFHYTLCFLFCKLSNLSIFSAFYCAYFYFSKFIQHIFLFCKEIFISIFAIFFFTNYNSRKHFRYQQYTQTSFIYLYTLSTKTLTPASAKPYSRYFSYQKYYFRFSILQLKIAKKLPISLYTFTFLKITRKYNWLHFFLFL